MLPQVSERVVPLEVKETADLEFPLGHGQVRGSCFQLSSDSEYLWCQSEIQIATTG